MQRTLLAILIFLGFVMTQKPALGQQPGDADKPAIEAVVAQFMDAWNQHDAHAFAALFAEDADFTNIRGDHVHGRLAVEQFHAPMFRSVFKESHQTAQLRSVRFLTPDIAIADIDWQMTGALAPTGAVRPPRQGLLAWAMTRIKGHWLITVMHNAEFSPPMPPVPPK